MTKLIHRIANVVLNENNQSNTTKLHLLERVMRQILRIPGFHYLGSALRKLVAVLEPVGQVTMVNSLAAAMSGDTEGIT